MRIIKNIYWEIITDIRLENELNTYRITEMNVKQGCVFLTGFIRDLESTFDDRHG